MGLTEPICGQKPLHMWTKTTTYMWTKTTTYVDKIDKVILTVKIILNFNLKWAVSDAIKRQKRYQNSQVEFFSSS